jgi:hypothetical protein
VTTAAASLAGREVIAHLDEQIASARRLLGSILAQGEAIRSRDVEGVVARLAEIKTEMSMRERLEQDRGHLLARAGMWLGVSPAAVTLDAICELMSPVEAEAARTRSAELRGLLGEIVREHGINRALMRQELTFLSHLVRLLGNEAEGGYAPPAGAAAPSRPTSVPSAYRVLDLQA